jgi:type IV pilus assembly protein PilW
MCLAKKHWSSGFTLVELLIGLTLGLLVLAGVIGVLLSTREVSRQTEGLARLQESARYALDVVGRDLREVGGIACGANVSVTNAVANPTANWWSNWDDGQGIHGYGDNKGGEDGDCPGSVPETFPAKATGTAAMERDSGTDAIILRTSTAGTLAIISAHTPTGSTRTFTVTSAMHGFEAGEVLMACDYSHAALFQVTGVSGASIEYSNTVDLTAFAAGSQIGKLSSNAWYIGTNGRGGKSLYRVELTHSGSSPATETAEVAENVSDLQIQYLTQNATGTLATDYVDATCVTDWARVVAARIAFKLQTAEAVGTNGQPIELEWKSVVSLRNRLP